MHPRPDHQLDADKHRVIDKGTDEGMIHVKTTYVEHVEFEGMSRK